MCLKTLGLLGRTRPRTPKAFALLLAESTTSLKRSSLRLNSCGARRQHHFCLPGARPNDRTSLALDLSVISPLRCVMVSLTASFTHTHPPSPIPSPSLRLNPPLLIKYTCAARPSLIRMIFCSTSASATAIALQIGVASHVEAASDVPVSDDRCASPVHTAAAQLPASRTGLSAASSRTRPPCKPPIPAAATRPRWLPLGCDGIRWAEAPSVPVARGPGGVEGSPLPFTRSSRSHDSLQILEGGGHTLSPRI